MKPTQIFVLTLTALTNYKHMAITAFMAKALKMFSILETKVGMFVAPFLAAYDKENEAFMRIERKTLTKKMSDADTARINALRVIIDALKIFHFRPDEAQKALAQQVTDVIDLYGGTDIYRLPMDARTGAITNLVEDLEDKLSDEIEALNLTAAVEALHEANEQFLTAQSNRDLSDSEYGKSTMLAARAETDKAWRAIVETTNNIILFGTAEESAALIPFAKYMNVEIDKYRIQTGQGVGGNWGSGVAGGGADSSEDGGGAAPDPVMKNATFRFIDGTAIVLPFEVGTPIEAPANTLGYKWKPKPELMPKTNKTFNEVPIEDKEATATFHFLDHSEEVIKQVIGTALQAPDNTFGCYWTPEVPALMPAEDTSYYEMPIEQEGDGENNENQQPEDNENQQPEDNENNGGSGGGDQTGGGTTNPPSGPNTDAWGDGDEGDGSDV